MSLYRNYVVQYIIELRIPSVTANLIAQFKGHYVYLSKQKFSSHVVEKCLKHFGESRSQIVHELLSVPHFEQLLQDPYANYVIQSALTVTKGLLHAALLEAARPHSFLRTSPYCKRIFSRNLSKK
ncbi:putative pumilio homolog 7, chloroplastic [Pistacia vera]|uniref:putative pumilio homolog 7, chloroplastic n=1 Tax=Pistacia vera TaxID=55513 RepID=UPI00126341DE|nr:putative pumilio homolog 7, chloroplastic [Pistacia vera]